MLVIKKSHLVIFLVLLLSLHGLTFTFAAWSGPTAAPPGDNASAPINVGTVDQVKNGGLSLNALAMFGNALFSGTSRYISFGSTAGSAGYGIRDNNGVLEFRNSGGSWAPFSSSTSAAAPTQLHNNMHTSTQCQSAGGVVRTAGTSQLCELTGASCPSGWTRLSNWGATAPSSCSSGQSQCTPCSTGSHAFANAARETCTYTMIGSMGACNMSATCTAAQTTVGCY